MTSQEAIAKARKLWGDRGAVEFNPERENKRTGKKYPASFTVGTVMPCPGIGGVFLVMGSSPVSYEDAFTKATQRDAELYHPMPTCVEGKKAFDKRVKQ